VLTGAIRKDSSSDVESITIRSCFSQGGEEEELWAVGGWNTTLGFGLRFMVP